MKNHLYETPDGLIHACEGGQATIDQKNYLVWTLCELDVPANKSFRSNEEITCPKCVELTKDK